MRTLMWLALGKLALGLGRVLSWIMSKLEEQVAEGNGPKEQAALDSLDKAIEDLAAWRDAQDENDAGQIAARTDRIRQLMGPRPGEAVDALTGVASPIQHSSMVAAQPEPAVPEDPDNAKNN